MDSQFLNHGVQNDLQTQYQNQPQTPNQQQQQQYAYEQSIYEQQMNQQQAMYQQTVYEQQMNQQQYMYQQPSIVVQIPVYSEEQLQMQEKIRADQFGLLQTRKKLNLEIMIYLMLLSVTVMISTVSFFQLIGQGSVVGISLSRFLLSEVYILNAAYITAVVGGIFAIFALLVTFFQVKKVRVESIYPFELTLKFGIILGSFAIAIVFFLSAFWLMMSLSTYWLLFLFQVTILIVAMIMTFRVINKAEKIAQIARKNNIQTVKKPVAESYYYEPTSYENEIRYLQ